MKLSIHTLLSISTGIGLVLAGQLTKNPVIPVIVFALPFLAMAIGLTCPRRGNQLDPRGHWVLGLIFKAWLTIVGCVLVWICGLLIVPDLDDRVKRVLYPRRYMVISSCYFRGDESLFRKIEQRIGSELEVVDVDGNVGSVEAIGRHGWRNPDTLTLEEVFILTILSETRFLSLDIMREAEFGDDRRLHLKQTPISG